MFKTKVKKQPPTKRRQAAVKSVEVPTLEQVMADAHAAIKAGGEYPNNIRVTYKQFVKMCKSVYKKHGMNALIYFIQQWEDVPNE